MKKTFLLLCAGLTCGPADFSASAQTTSFTYQGQLQLSGSSASGNFDMQFSLYTAAAGGTLASGMLSSTVPVSAGLFQVPLDFGSAPFAAGADVYLQIDVRSNPAPSGVVFTALAPRQRFSAAPYSVRAATAGAATTAVTAAAVGANGVGTAAVQDGSITAAKIGAGQAVKSLNGLRDEVSLVAGANLTLSPSGNTLTLASPTWALGGNGGVPAGSFVGTVDAAPLELRANGARGLQLDYVSKTSMEGDLFLFQRSMNTLGGYWGNAIASGVIGATIAGGGLESGLVLSGSASPNVAGEDFASIGGGYGNRATGFASSIPGGYNNSAAGNGSLAAGRNAHVSHDGSFLWGDGSASAASTAPNRFEVLASGGVNFFNGAGGVNIDMLNGNTGDMNYGLRFGNGGGEGIGSKRTPGGNLNGLDFYTGGVSRMSVANNGNVGIGTSTPAQQLEVNGGFLLVDGFGGEQAYLGGDGIGGDVQIGSMNPDVANVAIYNASSRTYMHLYAKALTITGGADLAEPFEMSSRSIPEGAVVIIDDANPGRLKMSDSAYDSRVAGIVSGAGGIHPGIQLKQQGVVENGQNVALTGRVYALADASAGSIKPGDLLTTSTVPGHCMRARDRDRAQGAILGKAMTGLAAGEGKVLVLVTLQ